MPRFQHPDSALLTHSHTDETSGSARHIIDVLIAERGKHVMAAPWWPLFRPLAYRMLRYFDALEMADAISNLPAEEVFVYLSNLLQVKLTVEGLDRIPAEGPCILVSNHPTGIADGVALYDAVKSRRRDISIFANRDAVRVNPRLAGMIVPVEWRAGFKTREKTRETLKNAASAFERNRAVVLFPSGRLAYMKDGKLTERPWMTSALALARRHQVPVIPIHMGARNSRLFYFLAKVSIELRDMTVFNELLNKKGAHFRFHVGEPLAPGQLDGDLAEVTDKLRIHCAETLAQDPDARFSL
ncbi:MULTISPECIES: GNAT family N-acetyltransferase [unclassified Pannonibacter]|uniref:GNAT family N-acetyltransferase n=1 Tax=unclassified Pannonibacter TaxID=2627228 RepID=UPI001647CEE8|nr:MULTISPECIES: 1-acyl-sn-glycerol-3-phosphate acyltransferase [unclassified Pannonibacter]